MSSTSKPLEGSNLNSCLNLTFALPPLIAWDLATGNGLLMLLMLKRVMTVLGWVGLQGTVVFIPVTTTRVGELEVRGTRRFFPSEIFSCPHWNYVLYL